MTPEALKKMNDAELSALAGAAQTELEDRRERRKREAMKQIRELAASAELKISFGGVPKRSGRASRQRIASTE